MLRMFASLALLIVAAVAGLVALIGDAGIDHTIENSKKIMLQFERAQTYGAAQTGNGAYQVRLAPIDNALCDDSDFQRDRKSAGEKTLLTVWRGEWTECYSPMTKTSTLMLDRNTYFMFGNLALQRVAFGLASLLSLCAALHVFAGRPMPLLRKRKEPQPKP